MNRILLTPDERRLLEEYRKARVRREVLHVVPRTAMVKIYRFKQEAATSTAFCLPIEEQLEAIGVQ